MWEATELPACWLGLRIDRIRLVGDDLRGNENLVVGWISGLAATAP